MSEEKTDTTTSATETTDVSATTDADSGKTESANTAETNDGADADSSTVLGSATDGTGDGEGDGEKADADDKDDANGDAGVPEAYDLKVTAKDAEGKDVEVEIDTELLAEATPVLKELGLSNEAANKLAPFILKAQERATQRQNDEFATVKADWAKQAKDDPEIGGKAWKDTTALSAKALDHFIGPVKDAEGKPNEFRQLLDQTGLGNHPAMIRAFRKIGEALSEDGTIARSDAVETTKKSREEALYPDDVPKK